MSMINTVKQKMALQSLNPETQNYLDSLNRQSDFHSQAAMNTNPYSDMLINAGGALLSSPKDEGHMQSLGRAISAGSAGLDQGMQRQEVHIEKSLALKKLVNDTHRFVESYFDNKKYKEEVLNLKREQISAMRENKELDHARKDQLIQEKSKHDWMSQHKPILEKVAATRNIQQKQLQLAEEAKGIIESGKVNSNSLTSKLSNMPFAAEKVGVGDREDITHLASIYNQMATLSAQALNPGGRITDSMLRQSIIQKPNINSSTNEQAKLIEEIIKKARTSIKESEFIDQAVQKGYSPTEAQKIFHEMNSGRNTEDDTRSNNEIPSKESLSEKLKTTNEEIAQHERELEENDDD